MSDSLLPTGLSAYELLITSENFQLAWERVRYFDRFDSRDWVGLKVFAANKDYNLEILRQSLVERTFTPSFPEIKYIPKPSLTLRPMAILPISDRIIFQAIANVIAERGRSNLAMVANRQSFANVLAMPNQKKFFVSWKKQYGLFQDKFCELIKEDNVWLAETDVAAFYEMVDHSLLFKQLLDRKFLDERSLEYLKNYLPIWSSLKSGRYAARGVPQGCLASDLLANIFLYDLDQELAVQEYHYLRYVDDIRILAKKKESVQRGLIKIDTSLKSIGLLLQTIKTTVRQIVDLDEEIDRQAFLLSEIDRRLNEPDISGQIPYDPLLETSLQDVALLGEDIEPSISAHSIPTAQESLKKVFWQSKEAIDRDGGDQFSERHLRFCLYRLEPDDNIVSAILPYFVEKPWLSEIITIYLRKCKLGQSAIKFLKEIIATHIVYDSVVALAIDILIRQDVSLRSMHEIFRQWVSDGKRSWSLLCAATIALGESSDNMLALLKTMHLESPTVRRVAMIQALRIAQNRDEAIHIFKEGIYDTAPVVIDALLYQLYNEWGLTLADLELEQPSLAEYCVACAKGYDRSLPTIQPDYIRLILSEKYNVEFADTLDFHNFLNNDYERAAEFLWQAENSFLVNPSRYVSQLDLFHEELLYPILVDRLQWKSSRDDLALVNLPDRIKYFLTNRPDLGAFGSALLECHTLRVSCPESHTRLHRQLLTTSPITWRQRNALRKSLCAGYQTLVNWILSSCP